MLSPRPSKLHCVYVRVCECVHPAMHAFMCLRSMTTQWWLINWCRVRGPYSAVSCTDRPSLTLILSQRCLKLRAMKYKTPVLIKHGVQINNQDALTYSNPLKSICFASFGGPEEINLPFMWTGTMLLPVWVRLKWSAAAPQPGFRTKSWRSRSKQDSIPPSRCSPCQRMWCHLTSCCTHRLMRIALKIINLMSLGLCVRVCSLHGNKTEVR